jgi:phosphatidylglycerophosphatase GEP4
MLNLNLSASLNVFKLLFKPGLCMPHHTAATFNELPIPLDRGLFKEGRRVDIRAVVLDKDDCFAIPDDTEVYGPYRVSVPALRPHDDTIA